MTLYNGVSNSGQTTDNRARRCLPLCSLPALPYSRLFKSSLCCPWCSSFILSSLVASLCLRSYPTQLSILQPSVRSTFNSFSFSATSSFQLQSTFQLRSTPQLHIFPSYNFSRSPKCATLPSCGTVATTLFLLTACARIATSSTSMSRAALPPTGPTTNAFSARSLDRLNSTS